MPVIGCPAAWNVLWREALISASMLAVVVAPATPVHGMGLDQPPGWTFDVQAHLPDTAGETAEFRVVTTLLTNEEAEVSWEFRLQLPDGEEARFGRDSESYSKGFRGAQDTATLQWKYADAGPYVGRVVWLDGDRETVVAEAGGWLGSPDAPLLRLQSLETDPPTPRVGQPATVSVAVTNDGKTSGSRLVGVWVWPDQQSYLNIGTLGFYDVAPGETRTKSFVWVPKLAVNGTRLTASKTELSRGLAVEPYTVLAAANDGALAADAEQDVPLDQPAEDSGG